MDSSSTAVSTSGRGIPMTMRQPARMLPVSGFTVSVGAEFIAPTGHLAYALDVGDRLRARYPGHDPKLRRRPLEGEPTVALDQALAEVSFQSVIGVAARPDPGLVP